MVTPFDVFRTRYDTAEANYRRADRTYSGWTHNAMRAYGEWEESTIKGIRDLARIVDDPFVTWIAAEYGRYDSYFWYAAKILLRWDYLTECGMGPTFLARVAERADEVGWCDEFLTDWARAQKAGFIPLDADPVEIFEHENCGARPSFAPDDDYADDDYDDD